MAIFRETRRSGKGPDCGMRVFVFFSKANRQPRTLKTMFQSIGQPSEPHTMDYSTVLPRRTDFCMICMLFRHFIVILLKEKSVIGLCWVDKTEFGVLKVDWSTPTPSSLNFLCWVVVEVPSHVISRVIGMAFTC